MIVIEYAFIILGRVYMPTKAGKTGFAVVGCGEISTLYVPAVQVNDKAEVVWCADVVESQAKRIGEHFNCPWTTDVDTAIADEEVDVVIVAVPHAYHAPITIQAAKNGKHVMCDKPISTNRKDAMAMIDACKKAGVKLGVNLCSRYQPFANIAKQVIDSGAIGDINLVKVNIFSKKGDTYYDSGWMEGGNTSWRASKELAGGGIGIMNMTHEIDRLRYCTGLDMVHVKGESDTFTAPVEVEDTLAAVWRYSNGAIGTMAAGSNMFGPAGEVTRIFGTHGQMELWQPVRVFTIKEDTEYPCGEWHEIPADRMDNNYIPYVEEFLEAIEKNTPAPITGEDGYHVLDFILGVYDSSENGETVYMNKEILS